MNYYTQKTNNGAMNISENAFIQCAEKVLIDLASEELKDCIALKYRNRTCKAHCAFDGKKGVSLTVEIFLYADHNIDEASDLIQKRVYDSIYSVTEIANCRVNVSVLGVIVKK